MGAEASHLHGMEIDDKAVEVSDYWSLCNAGLKNENKNVSVFVGELMVTSNNLWPKCTPLEKYIKNLMLYRHPSILRYISSWQKNAKNYLAVENVRPLSQVLSTANTIDVILGLHSILKALCFLHEKAQVSHNNLCVSSIYVAKDGIWKIGNMEYLCKYVELNEDTLKKSKNSRYSKGIDPNEEKYLKDKTKRKDFIDLYAFAKLVLDTLKPNLEDEESIAKFRELCENLTSQTPNERHSFKMLLNQEIFSHTFVEIHSFLIELPLKKDEEKTEFFTNLHEKLRDFDEITVASRLGTLLLSRMVLQNKVSQENLVPLIFTTKEENDGLFSTKTFKKYIVPILLEIFRVRDAQIRFILLEHFTKYVTTFTNEELKKYILPELLLGIKDTNDDMVAATLQILSFLVPILGAATVIGGKRAKLFTDSNPGPLIPCKLVANNDDLAVQGNLINEENDFTLETNTNSADSPVFLPERQRPDGEEIIISSNEEPDIEEELSDNWGDWDTNQSENHLDNQSQNIPLELESPLVSISEIAPLSTSIKNTKRKISLPDITQLDIKNMPSKNDNDDIDFFKDMAPEIQVTQKFVVGEDFSTISSIKSKFKVEDNGETNDGWGEEEW